MNPPIAMVATPGTMIGNTILWKMVISIAPSILAASSSDMGSTDSRYCFKKNTVPGAAIAGMIKGT